MSCSGDWCSPQAQVNYPPTSTLGSDAQPDTALLWKELGPLVMNDRDGRVGAKEAVANLEPDLSLGPRLSKPVLVCKLERILSSGGSVQ